MEGFSVIAGGFFVAPILLWLYSYVITTAYWQAKFKVFGQNNKEKDV